MIGLFIDREMNHQHIMVVVSRRVVRSRSYS